MAATTIKLQFRGHSTSIQHIPGKVREVVQLWRSRAHQRRRLANLSPEQLRDVGISFDAALAESVKPFWRA